LLRFRNNSFQTLKDWLILDDQLSQDEKTAPKSYYQALYEFTSAEEGDLCLALNDFVTGKNYAVKCISSTIALNTMLMF